MISGSSQVYGNMYIQLASRYRHTLFKTLHSENTLCESQEHDSEELLPNLDLVNIVITVSLGQHPNALSGALYSCKMHGEML